MPEQLNHAWRILATAASFALFGIGGTLLWLVAFPLLKIAVRHRGRRALIARRWVQLSFAGFMMFMRHAGVLTCSVTGAERLQRPGLLILANHPTLIDVVFLISRLPNADCVVKSGLRWNPFTRGAVSTTGYVTNVDGNRFVDTCITSINEGSCLVIFPEGTRSPMQGGLQPFQRGATNVAIRGKIDITPVVIRCSPPTLRKGEKWYRVPSRRFHISMEVLPDLAIDQFTEKVTEPIAARRLTEHLTRFFEMELARDRA